MVNEAQVKTCAMDLVAYHVLGVAHLPACLLLEMSSFLCSWLLFSSSFCSLFCSPPLSFFFFSPFFFLSFFLFSLRGAGAMAGAAESLDSMLALLSLSSSELAEQPLPRLQQMVAALQARENTLRSKLTTAEQQLEQRRRLVDRYRQVARKQIKEDERRRKRKEKKKRRKSSRRGNRGSQSKKAVVKAAESNNNAAALAKQKGAHGNKKRRRDDQDNAAKKDIKKEESRLYFLSHVQAIALPSL